MKVVEKKAELCIGCHACEQACSKVLFKVEDPEKSAIRIFEKADEGFDINVCNQCGECIDICPVEAIYRGKNGSVMINKEKCVGCFACVGFCPISAMRQHKDYTEPFKCISCGACTRECPTEAIFMKEKEE